MIDITSVIVSVITAITTILGIYLKERLFPKLKQQSLTVTKSNFYLELDIICHKIKESVKADGVYIAYFHNGGHFITGIDMDKYTVVGEDYSPELKSYKAQYKDVLVNSFSYLFHNLLVSNRHYLEDINKYPDKDRGYKEDLKNRNINSTFTFLVRDPIKKTPIGFISIEYSKANTFAKEVESYIWKHQNDVANLLNSTKF